MLPSANSEIEDLPHIANAANRSANRSDRPDSSDRPDRSDKSVGAYNEQASATTQPLHLSTAQTGHLLTASPAGDSEVAPQPLPPAVRELSFAPSYLADPDPSGSAATAAPVVPSLESPESRSDGLDALHAQLSPWAGGGITVVNRSGQAGYDQLTGSQYELEASTVLNDAARVTVIAQPVILEAGTSSATPIYGFGTVPTTAPTASQSASGVGGELQLATTHVQASVGSTPSTFLVQNIIGGLVVSPTSSFSLHFNRQPITETMLSYAGMQDPTTGKVWGGVVATGGGAQLSRGDADFGVYGAADYQQLTGENVTSNTRFGGNVGAYWKAYENEFGVFTIGANLAGMHYAKNLQYFTFGQGGYFSPDAYVLFSAPLTWQSKPLHNFNYAVSAALGSQTYQQGAILPGSFLSPASVVTNNSSANYNVTARGAYRVGPSWYLEGYLAASNSNDYQQNTVGFSIRHVTRPHPENESLAPTGLFDHHEPIRPLLIP
jgi:hypothetical protein